MLRSGGGTFARAPRPCPRRGNRRALRIALIFTVAFGLVEAVCGYLFGSLALISDAVHNVSDGFAIALALAAAWASGLPARGARTFGWRRAEVLAALVNGVTLVVLSIVIVWQALERLVGTQPAVTGWAVVIVGAIGLLGQRHPRDGAAARRRPREPQPARRPDPRRRRPAGLRRRGGCRAAGAGRVSMRPTR